MTEDEAKTKWCPFTRWTCGGADNWHNNREGWIKDGEKMDACIASACMAWRLEQHPISAPGPGGYCGLAGRPSP